MPSAAGIYYAIYEGGQKDQNFVVLLHGVGGSHQSWPAEIRRLAGQRVLALDLPGHGHSPGVGLQSISAYADQVIEFLTSLGLYQVALVGHGMGGAIAIEVALRYASLVSGLGLISSGAYLGVEGELLDGFSNPYTLEGALTLFQHRAFSPTTGAGIIQPCLQAMRATRGSVLAADWRACAAFDRRNDFASLSVPAWIIAGTDDRLTPVAYAHFMAGSLLAAKLQIISHAGHMVMLEKPAQVAQGLQQFMVALAALRRSAPGLFPLRQPEPGAVKEALLHNRASKDKS